MERAKAWKLADLSQGHQCLIMGFSGCVPVFFYPKQKQHFLIFPALGMVQSWKRLSFYSFMELVSLETSYWVITRNTVNSTTGTLLHLKSVPVPSDNVTYCSINSSVQSSAQTKYNKTEFFFFHASQGSVRMKFNKLWRVPWNWSEEEVVRVAIKLN